MKPSDPPQWPASPTTRRQTPGRPGRLRYGLDSFADTDEARRVESFEARSRADVEIVDRLMFAGYEGQDWDEFVDVVVAYGLRVLTAWILDSRIVKRCGEKGLGAGWDSRCRDPQVAGDLAVDTLVVAVERFRDEVLKPRLWNPDRGASLRTYFIGQCLKRYPNVYRFWSRQQRHQAVGLLTSSGELPVVEALADSPETIALRQLGIDTAFENLPERDQRAVVLRGAGYRWDEVALLCNDTVAAIRSRLRRFGAKFENRYEEGA